MCERVLLQGGHVQHVTLLASTVPCIVISESPCLFPVLPSLLPLVTTPDPSLRHGALLAVAEITHALYKQAQSREVTLEGYLGAEVTLALTRLVPRVRVQLIPVIYLAIRAAHPNTCPQSTCTHTHTHTYAASGSTGVQGCHRDGDETSRYTYSFPG